MTALIPSSTMNTIRNRGRRLYEEGYCVVWEFDGVYRITDGDRSHEVDTRNQTCDCRGYRHRGWCSHLEGIHTLVRRCHDRYETGEAVEIYTQGTWRRVAYIERGTEFHIVRWMGQRFRTNKVRPSHTPTELGQ